MYQTTIHAVGLIRLPDAQLGGTRVEQPASNIDLLPTALQWLGLTIPEGVDGAPIDLGAPDALSRRRQFGQATKPAGKVEAAQRWANMRKARFVRQGPFKFIQVPHRNIEELYHLEADPGERNDLLRNPTAQARALADELRQALESWAASAAPLPSTFERPQRNETTRRLRSLGYVR